MNLKKHINIALGYFIIAAVLGVVLRSFNSIEVSANYKFIVHTHSHIALLGWVYLGLTTLLYKIFLERQELNLKYRRLFWFTQVTLIGMLLSFPFQGYALFSITFSTLFLIASYWFAGFFMKYVPTSYRKTNSYKCAKFALWYMVLSSLGPWTLGAIMNTLGTESIWYRMSIYFYLHFQYNGWMILGLLSVFFHVMGHNTIMIPKVTFNRFFWLINLGIVFSFSLSTLWIKPHISLYVIGGLGAILQIMAFGILLLLGIGHKEKLFQILTPLQKNLLITVIALVGIKILLQLLTAFPYFANFAASITDFTIGYLHWTFLGVVTIGLMLFLNFFKLLNLSKSVYYLYLLGFFLTETMIFVKGILAWQRVTIFKGYFEVLAISSLLLPLALLILLGMNLKRKLD
ncbi:MAG: hypothetical protein GY931_03225 [Maribacter sp.]|nr:hypothetical protein [Maribacter sp.]